MVSKLIQTHNISKAISSLYLLYYPSDISFISLIDNTAKHNSAPLEIIKSISVKASNRANRYLLGLFNSIVRLPYGNNKSLIVTGNMAEKIKLDQNLNTPHQLQQTLENTGIQPSQAQNFQQALLSGKTIVCLS